MLKDGQICIKGLTVLRGELLLSTLYTSVF